MSEGNDRSRDENIGYWKKYLRDHGSHAVLLYLLEKNQEEKVKLEKEPKHNRCPYDDPYHDVFCRTLYMTARRDGEKILESRSHLPFEEAIFSCPTIVFAAAIDEIVLRNYIRHLLLDFFGFCDELNAMTDVLVEMYKHRVEVPIHWTKHDVESWWDVFPPAEFQGYCAGEQ